MFTLSRSLARIAGIVACATVVPLVAPAPATAQECSSSADENGCPYRCIGDLTPPQATPTDLGNSICQTIDNLAAVAQQIGDQASAYVQPAQQDLEALVEVTLEGAINPNSIQTYNTALQRTEIIEGRIDELLDDPVCGSEAALNELRQFFTNQAANLIAAGQIAGSTAEAAAALQPAIGEVQNVIAQLEQIAGNVQVSGSEAQKQYDILMTSMQELKTQLEELAALDVPGTVVAGAELVGSVGPFLTNCAGCTSALVAAVTSLGTGSTAAAGTGAACPETFAAWGGSCWGMLSFPVGLTASGIAGALASEPCSDAAEGVGQMAEYLEKISTLVSTSADLAEGIAESVATIMIASEALVKLAQELDSESEQELQSISASLATAGDALNASSGILSSQVAPKVTTLAGNVVQQIGTGVVTMSTCYNKLHAVALAISGDVLEGVNDLVLATARLVDGGQVVTNIATQGQNAATAAANYATTEFNALNTERNSIHNDLWGVNWPNIPQPSLSTFAHLTNVANPLSTPNPVSLGIDIAALETATLAVIPKAILEGKKAFLDLEGDADDAREYFDLAGSDAQSALTKLDNPGTLAVSTMQVPALGGPYAVIEVINFANLPTVGRTTLPTLRRAISAKDLLYTHLKEIQRLEFIERQPRGSQPTRGTPTGGTTCLTCPRDYAMTPIWQSLDKARVGEPVSIRVYKGRTLVADLGTHSPSRGGGWTSMPASRTVAPQARNSDPASGCGYRVVVASSRGQTLAETETCLDRGR